jgi:hypothetical protein
MSSGQDRVCKSIAVSVKSGIRSLFSSETYPVCAKKFRVIFPENRELGPADRLSSDCVVSHCLIFFFASSDALPVQAAKSARAHSSRPAACDDRCHADLADDDEGVRRRLDFDRFGNVRPG